MYRPVVGPLVRSRVPPSAVASRCQQLLPFRLGKGLAATVDMKSIREGKTEREHSSKTHLYERVKPPDVGRRLITFVIVAQLFFFQLPTRSPYFEFPSLGTNVNNHVSTAVRLPLDQPHLIVVATLCCRIPNLTLGTVISNQSFQQLVRGRSWIRRILLSYFNYLL